jgi:predicted ATP-dependent protease
VEAPEAVRDRCQIPWTATRRTFQPEDFLGARSPDTAAVVPMIGQARAVRAVDTGLRMGAHMFLLGPVGTGKTTYALEAARRYAAGRPTPDDILYVPNFEQRDEPRIVAVPPGGGVRVRQVVETLVTQARTRIRETFESDAYIHHRQVLAHQFQDQMQAIWADMVNQARELGFLVESAPTGALLTIPLDPSGHPYRPEAFAELPDAVREEFAARQRALEEPLSQATRRVRQLEREQRQALLDDARAVAARTLDHIVEPLRQELADMPAALDYLDAVVRDLIQHVQELAQDDADGNVPVDWLTRYRVHVLVGHRPGEGAPVVLETNPTFENLFGRIEYQQVDGRLLASLAGIRAGAVHRANGGYLIIPAADLLREPGSYVALKRVLKQGFAPIENPPMLLWAPMAILRPDPVPLRITVLLVGPPELYYLLYAYDDEFRRLFTVKADFAADMPATPENLAGVKALVEAVAAREGWPAIGAGAVEAIAAYGARIAEDQERISTRMGELLAVLTEAAVEARAAGSAAMTGDHVRAALAARRDRMAGPEELLQRMVEDGTLLLDTDGAVVGQVNGLAVLSAGDQPFGRPSRITAVTHAGRQGIVAIERVTRQSGPSHTKGVLILAAYLANRFAQEAPLSLAASLTFEQMYNEVDGDSASSTELYALLSALADVPVAQGIAVTGSVNQRGEIQPIGGVNQKIEGFFRVCKARGLTGQQGVLIPRRNVRHLMLDDEVVEAIRTGQFHLWAVDRVEEGIAILTGWPAGTPADGPDTIMGRVAERLAAYNRALRRGSGEQPAPDESVNGGDGPNPPGLRRETLRD